MSLENLVDDETRDQCGMVSSSFGPPWGYFTLMGKDL